MTIELKQFTFEMVSFTAIPIPKTLLSTHTKNVQKQLDFFHYLFLFIFLSFLCLVLILGYKLHLDIIKETKQKQKQKVFKMEEDLESNTSPISDPNEFESFDISDSMLRQRIHSPRNIFKTTFVKT